MGFLALELLVACCVVLVPIRSSFSHEDKLIHLAAHAVPAFWFFMLYRTPFERRVLMALFLTLAILDEALQQFTPYHTMDIGDVLANAAGVALGWFLAESRAGHILGRMDHFLASSFRA